MLENMSNVHYYHPYFDRLKTEYKNKIDDKVEKVKEIVSDLDNEDVLTVFSIVNNKLKK